MPIAVLYDRPNFMGSTLNLDSPGTWVIPPGTSYSSAQVAAGFTLTVGTYTVVGQDLRPTSQSFLAPVSVGTVKLEATGGVLAPPAGYSYTPSYPGQPVAARDHRTGNWLYKLETPLWNNPVRPRRRKSSSLFSNPLMMMLLMQGKD